MRQRSLRRNKVAYILCAASKVLPDKIYWISFSIKLSSSKPQASDSEEEAATKLLLQLLTVREEERISQGAR